MIIKIKSGVKIENRTALIYMVIIYFVLIFLSRIIDYVLGTYFVKNPVNSELITLIIVLTIDFIALYAIVKFGYGEGIAEAFNLMTYNAFPFMLFYILGVLSLKGIIDRLVNIITFFPG